MEYKIRKYPLFSACGLNCGLCPRYHTDGKSQCPGCAGEDFLTKYPLCGILSCCQRHDIDCYFCDEYPCNKYDKADEDDSFITHKHQLSDFDKMKNIGLETYQAELNEKVNILEYLLDNYNNGRQKNIFCIAINLLELPDIKYVMEQISKETVSTDSIKEKSSVAICLFQKMADKQNIILKLRKSKAFSYSLRIRLLAASCSVSWRIGVLSTA